MKYSYSWHTSLSWALGIGLTGWIFAGLPGIVAIHGADFDHYYRAGEQIFRGENIYYDAQADWAREGIDSWYLYPPYFAAAFYPLTWLGPVRAKAVFAVFAAATLLGIDLILLSLRTILSPRAPLLDPFIHLLVLAPYPSSLLLGSLQIEGFLFLLFLLTVMGTLEIRRLWGTGCAYAAGVMIKLWPGPFLLSLAVVWRKRIFIPVLTIGLGAGFLFTGLAGWRVQWTFLQTILPALMHYADDYIDNQSLTLFLRESFSWSDGFIQMIRLAILASYALAVYHARDSLKNRNPRAVAVNASLFAAVSLLITPTAWSATHIRLLLPLATSGALSIDPSRRFSRWGFISLISVLLYIYPQGFFGVDGFYWLERYPLLWATLIQYGIFLYVSFQKNGSSGR
ncbi:MAG: glycosyltransferase family 87 protein [bacterium]